jgi:hypothetical protein
VTGFAAGVTDLGIGERQARVGGGREMVRGVSMTFGALLRADVMGARDGGRSEDGSIDADARDHQQAPDGRASEDQGILTPTVFSSHGGKFDWVQGWIGCGNLF